MMIDLHCHLLPGIDDGARDLAMSLAMARACVADGVEVVACTPHILPGVYPNNGPQILAAVTALQTELDLNKIPLRLVSGADNHVSPTFVADLRSGKLLPLAGSRYVLVEPPHHVIPPRLEELFFEICIAGYVPILTHPERLRWIAPRYDLLERLVKAGVWMQVTAGSLAGDFGNGAKMIAERMLADGLVHILASDAHDLLRRPPSLGRGRALAEVIVGEAEAQKLVDIRPRGILHDTSPTIFPSQLKPSQGAVNVMCTAVRSTPIDNAAIADHRDDADHGILSGLRRLFK